MSKKFFRYILSIFLVHGIYFAQNMDSLKLALKNAKHDTIRCIILEAIIEAENDDNIWPKYNEELLTLAENNLKTITQKNPTDKFYKKYLATALGNKSYLARLSGDIPKSLEYINKALKILEEIKDKQAVATTLSDIGLIYHIQGDIKKALHYYNKSLKIRQENNDKVGIAHSLINLGDIYNSQGDSPKALDYWSKSLKIMEEFNDKKGIATLLNNIGIIYYNQGEINKTLENYGVSLKILQEIGDKKGVATSMYNIGDIYKNQGNYVKAMEYYEKSLKIREEIGDKRGVAQSLNGYGIIYKNRGDISKAISFYEKSLTIRQEIGDKDGLSYSFINIGGIYLKQKNYAKALEFLTQAMKISQELGYPENIRDAAEDLNKIYKATGNYKLALENYEVYIRMRDSINNIEAQKNTIKQLSKYEFDKQKALDDEKHKSELDVQAEKAKSNKKKQTIIIFSVSLVLLLLGIFSFLLYNRFKTTQKQKQIIEVKEKETQHQKHLIEEKQKEIVDSINYAKRIQYTLLAHEEFLKTNLNEHFTFFNPKDIVSGDFYWATSISLASTTSSVASNLFYLAVCDSTGHGVPGAFMSLLNIGFLNEAINEKGITLPSEIFDYVRQKLTDTISKEGQKDGFDGILLCVDKSNNNITYAAANNAPILINQNMGASTGSAPTQQLIELDADRMPVGVGERKENFKLYTIKANSGDMLYLYTDGYADQFGGPKGKKFKYKQLNELLLANHHLPMKEQHEILKTTFSNWKGELEQVDDVCVIGVGI